MLFRSEDFPAGLVIGLSFAIVASYSPVSTLLKDADLIFLLPAEDKMGPYFRMTIIYSFVIQLYLILLVAAALGPLYFAAFSPDTSKYLLIIVVLVIFKIWNLVANWWMLKLRDPKLRWIDHGLRFVLNFFIFYFFVKEELIYAGILSILLFGLFLYNYYLFKKNPAIVWDLLVEKDRMRMHTFYRIANMFTDVPQLKTQIKKRHWLVSLLVKRISFKQDKTYDYLYPITTIRSGDYFGMYLRLFAIGALAIYFVPNLWIKIAFSILFIYLSGFQMMTLWQHHRTVTWIELYPVSKQTRQHALSTWLMKLMLIQVAMFGLLFLVMGNLVGLVFVWIGGTLFSYLFVQGYVKKRLT